MKKSLFMLAVLISSIVQGQEEAARVMMAEGKEKIEIAVRNWNGAEIMEAKSFFERANAVAPQNPWTAYWKAYADYRLVIFELYGDNKDKEKAEALIEEACELLEKITEGPVSAEANALLGSLTGLKISLNPMSGMWNGPKAGKYFESAAEADPKNPRVFYLMGIGTMNTPSMFGGGPDKAISQFEKALRLYEAEVQNPSSDAVLPTWGYAGCHQFLGDAYAKLKKTDLAREYYGKALALTPGWKLVQNKLDRLNQP